MTSLSKIKVDNGKCEEWLYVSSVKRAISDYSHFSCLGSAMVIYSATINLAITG